MAKSRRTHSTFSALVRVSQQRGVEEEQQIVPFWRPRGQQEEAGPWPAASSPEVMPGLRPAALLWVENQINKIN
jgi:hypothetical protein